ncbi:MAG: chemotaxis protein CheB [Candidatus Riflebacteria bacterium]|nr:chemotaxis protein CheB [Candidatus Riflebacteria bacterium]
MPYKAVVIGTSAGGNSAISVILNSLPESFDLPIFVVQHISCDYDELILNIIQKSCKLPVKEAEDKCIIQKGTVYFAPACYHTFIENELYTGLSVDDPVKYARPSIDVLFESAARVYGKHLIGVILTGANDDGTDGMKSIKKSGGYTIVQDPATAEFPTMPQSAVSNVKIDIICPLESIVHEILKKIK